MMRGSKADSSDVIRGIRWGEIISFAPNTLYKQE